MKTITVRCPKCREALEVDARTGEVLRHHAEVRPKSGEDFFGERLKQIAGEQARREAVVAEGKKRESARRGELEKLFGKVREEHARGPAERPLRDIDVD